MGYFFKSCNKNDFFNFRDTQIQQDRLTTYKNNLIQWNDTIQQKAKLKRADILKSGSSGNIKAFNDLQKANQLIIQLAENPTYENMKISLDSANFVGLNFTLYYNPQNGQTIKMVTMNSLEKHKAYYVEYLPTIAHFLSNKKNILYNFTGKINLYDYMGHLLGHDIFNNWKKVNIRNKINTNNDLDGGTLETVVLPPSRKRKPPGSSSNVVVTFQVNHPDFLELNENEVPYPQDYAPYFDPCAELKKALKNATFQNTFDILKSHVQTNEQKELGVINNENGTHSVIQKSTEPKLDVDRFIFNGAPKINSITHTHYDDGKNTIPIFSPADISSIILSYSWQLLTDTFYAALSTSFGTNYVITIANHLAFDRYVNKMMEWYNKTSIESEKFRMLEYFVGEDMQISRTRGIKGNEENFFGFANYIGLSLATQNENGVWTPIAWNIQKQQVANLEPCPD